MPKLHELSTETENYFNKVTRYLYSRGWYAWNDTVRQVYKTRLEFRKQLESILQMIPSEFHVEADEPAQTVSKYLSSLLRKIELSETQKVSILQKRINDLEKENSSQFKRLLEKQSEVMATQATLKSAQKDLHNSRVALGKWHIEAVNMRTEKEAQQKQLGDRISNLVLEVQRQDKEIDKYIRKELDKPLTLYAEQLQQTIRNREFEIGEQLKEIRRLTKTVDTVSEVNDRQRASIRELNDELEAVTEANQQLSDALVEQETPPTIAVLLFTHR